MDRARCPGSWKNYAPPARPGPPASVRAFRGVRGSDDDMRIYAEPLVSVRMLTQASYRNRWNLLPRLSFRMRRSLPRILHPGPDHRPVRPPRRRPGQGGGEAGCIKHRDRPQRHCRLTNAPSDYSRRIKNKRGSRSSLASRSPPSIAGKTGSRVPTTWHGVAFSTQMLANETDLARKRIPEAIRQTYSLVVTVNESNDIQAFNEHCARKFTRCCEATFSLLLGCGYNKITYDYECDDEGWVSDEKYLRVYVVYHVFHVDNCPNMKLKVASMPYYLYGYFDTLHQRENQDLSSRSRIFEEY